MEKEYQQVRTIALRDARVQDAYRDADRRLEEKMLKIDPALESYIRARRSGKVPAQVAKPAVVATKPVKAAAPKPAAKPAAKVVHSKATHTVASGETLGGIAAKYGVSVAALKAANQIKDDRKLRIGQVLVIPGGKKTEAAPKTEKSFWDRFNG